MIRFISHTRMRLMAIAVALLAILGFTILHSGVAYASSQATQQWFGPSCGNGCGIYLGWPSGEWYNGHIHTFNAMSMCLDVPGSQFYGTNGLTTWDLNPSGAQVQLWTCMPDYEEYDYDKNQIWQQQDNGNGSWSYFVSNLYGNFCLDSLAGHHYNGSPVEVYQCNGDNAQRWTIGPGGQLQSVDSPGYCLDDTNWNPNDGAQMQLWQCSY